MDRKIKELEGLKEVEQIKKGEYVRKGQGNKHEQQIDELLSEINKRKKGNHKNNLG